MFSKVVLPEPDDGHQLAWHHGEIHMIKCGDGRWPVLVNAAYVL